MATITPQSSPKKRQRKNKTRVRTETHELYDGEAILFRTPPSGKVSLALSPYHPKLYKRMSSEKPIFLSTENEFRELPNGLGVRILGSYNPASIGCHDSEFLDGMHPKDSCMWKVINNQPPT